MEMENVIKPNTIGDSEIKVEVRTPRRILHFSDGTLEEFSDDDDEFDDEIDNKTTTLQTVDESSMPWSSWLTFKALQAGTKALSVCDYLGESLALLFGITSPKYSSEIENFKRQEEEREKEEKNSAGWTTAGNTILPNENLIHNQEKF